MSGDQSSCRASAVRRKRHPQVVTPKGLESKLFQPLITHRKTQRCVYVYSSTIINVRADMRAIQEISRAIYRLIGNPAFGASKDAWGEYVNKELADARRDLRHLLSRLLRANRGCLNEHLLTLLKEWGFPTTVSASEYRFSCQIQTPKGVIQL